MCYFVCGYINLLSLSVHYFFIGENAEEGLPRPFALSLLVAGNTVVVFMKPPPQD